MKRRLKSSVKYPFTTARGDFARNRGFEDPSEARKGKRVRFGDNERDDAPVVANSERYEAVQSPKCGAPKTSEYAYFKNMRCGAGRDRSRAYCEENDQKNSKINHFFRETSSASDKLKPSTHGLNFSVSGERAGPSDHNIFHSPRPSKYDESDKIRSKELTNQIKKKSPLLPENVTPVGQSMFSSPFYKASEKEENQCSGNGIFSAKRQRLREWAHSSHFEVEKLHLKGFDLVPLLLSRLFPEGNENNDSSKGVTVNSCKSLPVSKSNDLENRLDVSRKRDWDNDNNDSPKGVIVNSCKSLPVNKSNDLENRLDVSRKRDWDHDNIDSSKGVTANSCKSLPVSKSNDLDDLEYRPDVSRKIDWDNNNYDSSKGDTVNICELPTVSKSNDLENRLDISRKRDWDHDLYDSSKGDTVNICEFLTVSKSNDLLNRLYVSCERDWDNDNYDSSKGDSVNICKSLPVSQYNDLENRLDVPRKRNWDNDLPKACSGRWGDIVLAEQDKFISGLPSNYHKENHLLDEFMIPDKRSKSHEYRSSHTQLGFPLCLPFESYRSSGSSHLNELDEFGSIIERQREPYGLLLEWDNELGQDRRNSSIVNHGIEKNVLTRLDNSWNVNSSLSSAYYLESNTGQSFSSKGCLMPDFEPAFDDVKCAMEEPGQFPLALPYGPKCLTLGEDRNGKNVLSSSNIISSYRDEDWLNMKVWDGKPLSKLWWKCTSAPDDHPSVFHPSQFPENENRLFSFSRLKEASIEEPFTPLYEGVFNRCFLSPLPRSSLNTFVNHPLLLDHVSEDSPNQELYFDEVMNWDREKYFRCTFGDTLC